jgi:hypothetical protein
MLSINQSIYLSCIYFIAGTASFNSQSQGNKWDNGVEGNFWDDYNGNGSYVIDENNVDHYPLTNPVDINAQTPTPIPTATSYLPPSNRNAPHLAPIVYLIPISVIVAVVIMLSVLLYRRHRKTAKLSK